jgi:WD40 repeat protein
MVAMLRRGLVIEHSKTQPPKPLPMQLTRQVEFWNTGSGKLARTIKLPAVISPDIGGDLRLTPDGKTLLGTFEVAHKTASTDTDQPPTSRDIRLETYDATTGALLRSLPLQGEEKWSQLVALSPDGTLAATASHFAASGNGTGARVAGKTLRTPVARLSNPPSALK